MELPLPPPGDAGIGEKIFHALGYFAVWLAHTVYGTDQITPAMMVTLLISMFVVFSAAIYAILTVKEWIDKFKQ